MKIPTARDISRDSTRSGRIANSGPVSNVGAAMAGFGQDLVQSAFNLKNLADKEVQELSNKRGNDVSTALTNFLNSEEEGFLKARDSSSESGIGFTRQYIEGYQKRANDFAEANFAGLNDDDQTRYNNTLLGRGNSLYEKAYDFETKAKTVYYDRNTNGSLDKVRTLIRSSAAPFDQLKAQGLEAINSADMPETWKAIRRQEWEADAAESKWRWKFEQSPATALSELKAPVGGNVGRAYQRLISKGWSPAQAAGIVGNLSAESGVSLNTQARNPGDGRDGSDSIGIAQWNGDRARALKSFAAAQGTDWHDLDTQVDFIDNELRTSERQAGENLARSKTAEDAAAAFVGYERPAGWQPGNAKGAMHWEKRRDAALRIAGENPAAEDSDLDAIPYDRREQLATWGETQYGQQRALERTRVKDSYNLLIASKPEEVDENVILRDNTIDDGDKAALINSLRSAMKETGQVNSFIRSLGDGGASVNPFDADETKVADKAYEKMVAGADDDQKAVVASGFVAGTKYIPKQIQADLRQGAASTDVAAMEQAMSAASVLQKNAPIAFSAIPGGDDVRKNLDLYRTYTNDLGFTSEEAARRLIDRNNPDKMRARDALRDSKPIKKLIDGIDADTVASEFSKGWSSPSVGGLATPEQIKVGVNSEAEAVLVEDYREAFREALVDTNGNEDAAKEVAKKRFAKRNGPSQFTVFGSNVIIRNPPEAAYPAAPDGTHDYIREQAIEGVKGMGVPKVDNVYLQPDNETEKDIRAGRPPRYRVFFETDEGLQLAPYYFTADPAAPARKAEEEAAKQIKDAETRMIEKRTQDVNEQEAVDRALSETVGPDWMKARAAETAVEKQRMDKAFGGPIIRESPSTNDKAGGGGGF